MDTDVLIQASALCVYGEQVGTKIVSFRVSRFSPVGYHWYLCAIFVRHVVTASRQFYARAHTHTRARALAHTHTHSAVSIYQRQSTHPHPHCPQRIMYNRISKDNCHAGWVSICHMKLRMYGCLCINSMSRIRCAKRHDEMRIILSEQCCTTDCPIIIDN
jgi:hypothetical protein